LTIEQKEASDNTIQLEVINIDEIIIDTENRREINEEKVNDLVKSISEIGLLHPIIITTKKELIAGFHRLTAYKKLSFKEIPCKIVDESEIKQLLLKLIRLDENLVRNEGHYIERAKALLERKDIYEELYPETKRISTLKQYRNDKMSSREQLSFSQDIAQKLGISERTIEREIQIARDIIPEVQDFIKEQDIGKTDALLIAREKPQKQQQIIEELSAKTSSVKTALSKIRQKERVVNPALPDSLQVFNLWRFSGCDPRYGLVDYPGRIPGQIIENLLYYFTREDDLVIDPFAGGGTTIDVCNGNDPNSEFYNLQKWEKYLRNRKGSGTPFRYFDFDNMERFRFSEIKDIFERIKLRKMDSETKEFETKLEIEVNLQDVYG